MFFRVCTLQSANIYRMPRFAFSIEGYDYSRGLRWLQAMPRHSGKHTRADIAVRQRFSQFVSTMFRDQRLPENQFSERGERPQMVESVISDLRIPQDECLQTGKHTDVGQTGITDWSSCEVE